MPHPPQADDLIQRLIAILNTPAPPLPPEELTAFVDRYFQRREDYLRIAAEHPGPLYVLESAVLRTRARQMKAAFEKHLPTAGFYFAVKSNNHPDVSRIMLEEGFGLDVSSGLELEMGLNLDARDVVFSGPGKTDSELAAAVARSDRVVLLVDSFGELERLAALADAAERSVRCGVRLCVNPTGIWRKFGIPLARLPEFWNQARQHDRIRLIGLQFHSSWNLSPKPQIDFIRELGAALRHMPASFTRAIEFIDIGGGYWPSQGEWLRSAGTPEGRVRAALGSPEPEPPPMPARLPAVPIEAFAEQLAASIHRDLASLLPCRVCLEPGRWICNDAVQLLMSVVDKKAPDLVITDAGTNTVGWERFETDYFPLLNLTRPAMTERPCQILGSLCTPHDVWGTSYWGQDIQCGDRLMIPTQGAYTYSLRQHFIKPLPTVVTV